MNRRTSALSCLLLTAALLCALPSLIASLSAQDHGRMAERLRPKKAQTLTIWILSDATESKKHLNEQIALFEKQNSGVRVYLRRADVAELFADGAVLPNIVLLSPGSLTNPSRALLPLNTANSEWSNESGGLTAGRSAGMQYAVPLWFSPSVLAVPSDFLPAEAMPIPSPRQSSFFDLSTPAPTTAPDAGNSGESALLPGTDLIPWNKLLGAVTAPRGLDLIQLLSMCPSAMRPSLIKALTDAADTPIPKGRTAPQATSAPTPPAAGVMTLAEYQSAVQSGKALAAFALMPACTQRVLFAGICQDLDLSRAFLAHLLSPAAQAALPSHALLSGTEPAANAQGDALIRGLANQYQNGLLFPNAFEHTLQELYALCEDAFRRNLDPVQTLLRLR